MAQIDSRQMVKEVNGFRESDIKETAAIKTEAKIPVLDFSDRDLKPGTASWLSASKHVCHALEDYGCFALELGKRVPLELHNSMFRVVRELFDFRTEIKRQVTYARPFHGYSSNADIERMVIDNATAPEVIQKLTGIFWPNGNDEFLGSANSYAKVMEELNQMVTRMIFENYGAEKYYDPHMNSNTSHSLGFLKYTEPEKTETKEGLPSHTDKVFAAILHQNRVKGLKIRTEDDEWIGFDPSPSSFLFLAGDPLQMWSNDRIQACVHRVVLNETETRYTVALFAFNNGRIEVPEELVDEKHPLKYKPMDAHEYLKAQEPGRVCSIKTFCGV